MFTAQVIVCHCRCTGEKQWAYARESDCGRADDCVTVIGPHLSLMPAAPLVASHLLHVLDAGLHLADALLNRLLAHEITIFTTFLESHTVAG